MADPPNADAAASTPTLPRSPWSRAAGRIWLGWLVFAGVVVLAFAVFDRHNEGYKWLMAIVILWGSAFVAAAPAAVCAAASLLNDSPRRAKDGLVLLASLVAAALTAPGAYMLARGLSEWLPAFARCLATKC